jgi:hypothetical protein
MMTKKEIEQHLEENLQLLTQFTKDESLSVEDRLKAINISTTFYGFLCENSYHFDELVSDE